MILSSSSSSNNTIVSFNEEQSNSLHKLFQAYLKSEDKVKQATKGLIVSNMDLAKFLLLNCPGDFESFDYRSK